MDEPKQKIIFVAGPPGSGKSTQSRRMVREFNFKHISAGECLREEMERPNAPCSDLIKSHINAGLIVPVDITIKLLEQKIMSYGWGREIIVIDGFPRNANNVEGWIKTMEGKTQLIHVIALKCDSEISMERIDRRQSECERTDDTEDSLRNRLSIFHNETLPIIRCFQIANKCTVIDANRLRDEVWSDIKNLLIKLGFN